MLEFLQFQLLIFAAIRVEEVVEKAVDISPDPECKQAIGKVFFPLLRALAGRILFLQDLGSLLLRSI